MSNRATTPWSEARTKELIKLWATSISAREIGAILGVSRDAAIGKANRMGLARRANGHGNSDMRAAERAERHRHRQRMRKVAERPAATVAPCADGVSLLCTDGVSLFDISSDQCRWPLNITYPIDKFRFCGTPTDGGSYCAYHFRMSMRCGYGISDQLRNQRREKEV